MTARRRFSIITKVAGLLLATFVFSAQAQTYSVNWKSDPADPRRAMVEVSGAGGLKSSEVDLKRLLTVHVVSDETGNDPPPMLGTYQRDNDVIRFVPQFPLHPGMRYKAVLHAPGATISTEFKIPAIKSEPSTIVSQVYPSSTVVPENVLKFYVHFSSPMSAGGVYEHIHLLNSAGKPVELPFLQINEELWDPAMTRITLIIDPGRIKRGVKPLVDIGPVFETGKQFTLVIDSDCLDATGAKMKETFRKPIEVGPPDRDPPDPAKWKISALPAGTRLPVTIEFGKPMDHALALRMITIVDENHRPIDGQPALDQQERRWSFNPATPWRAGRLGIVIPTTIEDLSGNNIGKPFDVDVFNDVQKQIDKPTVTLPLEIR